MLAKNKKGAVPRPLKDFAAVLATDEPLFLVGGQAVNLWALYYRERTVGLQPNSTSKISSFINKRLIRKLPPL